MGRERLRQYAPEERTAPQRRPKKKPANQAPDHNGLIQAKPTNPTPIEELRYDPAPFERIVAKISANGEGAKPAIARKPLSEQLIGPVPQREPDPAATSRSSNELGLVQRNPLPDRYASPMPAPTGGLVQRHPIPDRYAAPLPPIQAKLIVGPAKDRYADPAFLATGKPPIQAKLMVGPAKDRYEQEADQVASQVVQTINSPDANSVQREDDDPTLKPQETLQRQDEEEDALQMKPEDAIQREDDEEEEDLQMKPQETLQRVGSDGGAISSDLETEITQAKGSGQPLDAGLQRSMGQAMGADFSNVKVHANSQADQLNQSIQAKAFTSGQDVFFRQGTYNPSSQGGQELIAHELTHVVQQSGGAVQRQSEEIAPTLQPQVPSLIQRQIQVQDSKEVEQDAKEIKQDAKEIEQDAKEIETYSGSTVADLHRQLEQKGDSFTYQTLGIAQVALQRLDELNLKRIWQMDELHAMISTLVNSLKGEIRAMKENDSVKDFQKAYADRIQEKVEAFVGPGGIWGKMEAAQIEYEYNPSSIVGQARTASSAHYSKLYQSENSYYEIDNLEIPNYFRAIAALDPKSTSDYFEMTSEKLMKMYPGVKDKSIVPHCWASGYDPSSGDGFSKASSQAGKLVPVIWPENVKASTMKVFRGDNRPPWDASIQNFGGFAPWSITKGASLYSKNIIRHILLTPSPDDSAYISTTIDKTIASRFTGDDNSSGKEGYLYTFKNQTGIYIPNHFEGHDEQELSVSHTIPLSDIKGVSKINGRTVEGKRLKAVISNNAWDSPMKEIRNNWQYAQLNPNFTWKDYLTGKPYRTITIEKVVEYLKSQDKNKMEKYMFKHGIEPIKDIVKACVENKYIEKKEVISMVSARSYGEKKKMTGGAMSWVWSNTTKYLQSMQ